MSLRSWIRNLFTRPASRTIRKAPRRVRLSLEALEDRTVPSTFTVFNTNDSGAGSLRDAITQAQSGANLGVADTIVFNNNPALGTNFYDSTPHIITLNTGLTTGQLTLTDTATTTISGPGANLLSISGNHATRVFGIDSGASAELSGLTITAGNAGMDVSGDFFGGGLANYGTTTLTNCTVSGNAAAFGGGVGNGGTATLTNCTLSGNAAVTDGADGHVAASGGGGVSNIGTATLTNCTVSGNRATSPFGSVGGGVSNYGAATLTNCTVSGNRATSPPSGSEGGGVYSSGTATLTNCTVSGNSADRSGGGVVIQGGTATLTNCTVSGNSANKGGGVDGAYGNITLGNTIVAGNSAGNSGPDVSGSVTSLGHNLIGDGQGADGFTDGENGDIVGVAVTDIFVTDTDGKPLLADNGGATQTIALLPGSPAIDAGSNDLIPPGVTTDQRYFARIVGGVVDIGAYEANAETPSLVVTTAADVVDPTDGQTSLREAIAYANALPTADTITFSNQFNTQQSITLTGGQLTLTDPATTTISGPGANLLSIDGGGLSRVFAINSGASAALSGLTITGGKVTDNGGGLLNLGTLTLTNSTISGNSATINGTGLYTDGSGTTKLTNCTISGNSGLQGAVFTATGSTTLTGCTVSGNSATYGAGVYTQASGTTTLTNCTVSGNSATYGAGVYTQASGTTTLTNCTVSGNHASENGGGVYSRGTTTLTNCTVSGNSAGIGGGIYTGYGATTLNNTIVAGQTSGGDIRSYRANITGSNNLIGGDPMLAPLADNGGPTQTMALLPGSPALDAGSNALAVDGNGNPLTTDQRGAGYPRIMGGTVDIGAYELQSIATTTTVAPALAAPVYGQTLTFTATVTATGGTTPAGSVRFTLDGNTFGLSVPLDASGHATSGGISTLDANGHTIAATYLPAANVTFLTSASGPTTFSIARANATVAVTGYTGGTYDRGPHTQIVTVTGVGNSTLFTTSLSATNAGSYSLPWSFSNANYNPLAGTLAFTINKATLPVTVSNDLMLASKGSKDDDHEGGDGTGKVPPLTGTVNGNAFTGSTTFTTAQGDTLTVQLSSSVTAKSPVGTYAIVAGITGAASANYVTPAAASMFVVTIGNDPGAGAKTVSFWDNKGNAKLINTADLSALRGLSLRNDDGSNFDPTTAAQLQKWLDNDSDSIVKALSVELAAMQLNVLQNTVRTSDVVYVGDLLKYAGTSFSTTGLDGGGFISIANLMTLANNALTSYTSPAKGKCNDDHNNSLQNYLDALEDALEAANNNTSFVQQTLRAGSI